MKYIFATTFLLISLHSSAQSLERAVQAMGKADANTIASLIEGDAELTILNETNFVNKSQLVAQLNKFFKNNPPKSISEMHRGTSKNSDSRYIISQLNAGSQVYRVYLYGTDESSGFVLREIRIEKE